jgi:hypothetical protein
MAPASAIALRMTALVLAAPGCLSRIRSIFTKSSMGGIHLGEPLVA